MSGGNVNLGGPTPGGRLDGSPPPGADQQYMQNAMTQAAGQALRSMSQSGMQRASQLVQSGASEIRDYVEKNHYSIHALSLIGGTALTVICSFSVLNIFNLLTPMTYLKLFFEIMFGFTICVVDGPSDKFPLGPRLKQILVDNAPLLFTNKGKSLFYLFIASLEGSQNIQEAFFHFVIGYYFLCIAIIHIALTLKDGGIQQQGPSNEAREPNFVPAA